MQGQGVAGLVPSGAEGECGPGRAPAAADWLASLGSLACGASPQLIFMWRSPCTCICVQYPVVTPHLNSPIRKDFPGQATF